jgi:hypothetical protein
MQKERQGKSANRKDCHQAGSADAGEYDWLESGGSDPGVARGMITDVMVGHKKSHSEFA